MKRVVILLCIALFALWGCNKPEKKTDNVNTESGVNGGGGENNGGGENGTVTENRFLRTTVFFFPPDSFRDKSLEIKYEDKSFATIKEVTELDIRCGWVGGEFSIVNTATGQFIKGNKKSCDTIKDMKLVDGVNYIEANLTETDGRTYRDRIVIIRNPTVDFTGRATFSQDEIREDDNLSELLVTVLINPETLPDKGSVKLMFTDNITDKEVLTLHDDGLDGDVMPNDGIYSGKFSTAGIKEGRYGYRVVATKQKEVNYTPITYLRVFTANLGAKITADFKIAKSIEKKYFMDVDEGSTLEEIIKYRQWVVVQIKDTPGLVKASVSPDGTLLLSFKHLKKFIVFAHPTVYDGGHSEYNTIDMPQITQLAEERVEIIKEREEFDKKATVNIPVMKAVSNQDPTMIWSNNMLILSPFISQFRDDDFYNAVFPMLFGRAEPFIFKIYRDREAGVEAFKNLHNYGIIALDSHGLIQDGDHLYATGQEFVEGDTLYQSDIEAGRLAIAGVSPLSIIGWGPEYYLVTHQFMAEYSEKLPNSLMYLSTCYSLKKNYEPGNDNPLYMDDLDPGAIIGFDSRVLPSYTAKVGKVFFDYLLGGYTVEEARDNVNKDVNSLWNYIDPFVNMVLRGNPKLRIIDESLKNGSFEDSLIGTWHCTRGSCSTFDNSMELQYAHLLPVPDGGKAAMLRNYIGYESGITQINKISKDAKMLSFSYAYDITSSSIDGTPNPCEGRFEAWMSGEKSKVFEFLKVVYDDLASQPLLKRTCRDKTQKDKRTSCYDLYYQPWKEVKVPLPSDIAGSRVNLEFYSISDRRYDNYCNGNLYLDNVTIQ